MNRRHAFKVAIASVVGLVTASTVKATSVDERWHLPTQDEDIWIPMRPNNERRVFSVNVPPEKADEYMKRLKEQFAKKKLCRR